MIFQGQGALGLSAKYKKKLISYFKGLIHKLKKLNI